MTCVILQPSYIPWRGYFHLIQKADFFVFYDDVQYDKHGWRNRNRIKTPQGSHWLTIPVKKKGNVEQHTTIQEVEVCWERSWNKKHLLAIQQAYRATPFYGQWESFLTSTYARTPQLLAPFTIDLTIDLSRHLGITHTRFVRSSELSIIGERTDRLVKIVRHLGCDRYITGPSAKEYLEEDQFANAGINLEYIAYQYPEYPQLYPPFDPNVSVLDLLFMTGPDAPKYIWE